MWMVPHRLCLALLVRLFGFLLLSSLCSSFPRDSSAWVVGPPLGNAAQQSRTRRALLVVLGQRLRVDSALHDTHQHHGEPKKDDDDEKEEWLQPKSPLNVRSFQYNNVATTDDDFSDLQPPVFNLRKESLLFDEHATTRRNNNVQRLWDFCVTNLPYVFHGCSTTASSSSNDDDNNEPKQKRTMDPMAALYNMMFVRFPVIATGCMYTYQWMTRQHNPLIVDLGIVGDGNWEVPPLVVGLVLWIILR